MSAFDVGQAHNSTCKLLNHVLNEMGLHIAVPWTIESRNFKSRFLIPKFSGYHCIIVIMWG